jgi:hypothetical protein
MTASPRSHAGRLDLARHPSSPPTADTWSRDEHIIVVEGRQQAGVAMLPRVAIEHSIDISEQNEQVGSKLAGNKRGQAVIVAEDGSVSIADKGQFVRRDCVIFVDDGHRPVREHGLKSGAEIEVTHSVIKVGLRKKELPRNEPKTRKPIGIQLHQPSLSDRSACLSVSQ